MISGSQKALLYEILNQIQNGTYRVRDMELITFLISYCELSIIIILTCQGEMYKL